MNIILTGILLLLAIGGLPGAIPLLIKPDGSLLHTSTDLLKHSPVSNYFWPGVFLLVVMSIWPIINIYGLLNNKPWARSSIISLGLVVIFWIVYEFLTIKTFSIMQPLVAVIGISLVIFGFRSK